jgi:YD repeat-containing protein
MGQDVSFSYDGIDRLISETNNDKIVGYVYDNNSNLTQLRYPSGRVIHKTFDANNRTQQITQKMAENNTENIRK